MTGDCTLREAPPAPAPASAPAPALAPALAPAASASARLRWASEPGFDFASSEYRALFETSDADAFRHPIWLGALYAGLAPASGAEPVVLTLRRPDGALAGLVPMTLRRKNGARLLEAAHLGVGDYAAPVLAPAAREALSADPSLAASLAALLPRHDVLRIQPIREERLADWRLVLAEAASPLDFGAHAARLGTPYPAWRAQSFSPSFRKYLDRRSRRFDRSGEVRLQRLGAGEARAAIADIRALRAGRFEGDPIQERPVEAFYAAVAVAGIEAGFVRLYRLTLDTRAVATVFALTDRGRLYYLLIGCDYARFGKHSPGLVMFDRMMEDWAGEGGETFDFTIGDEPFKADFATRPTRMHAILKPRGVRGRLALAAFRARAGLRAGIGRLKQRGRGPSLGDGE